MQLKWEFVFVIIIVICATVALCLSKLSQENFLYVLGLVFTFLGAMGYGYYRGLRVK